MKGPWPLVALRTTGFTGSSTTTTGTGVASTATIAGALSTIGATSTMGSALAAMTGEDGFSIALN
jgi:hypothetical protein